jgi:hypothetical protein
MAAKSIALGEDTVIFQGASGQLPAGVKAEAIESAGGGLLGEANPKDANDNDPLKVTVPIVVPRLPASRPGALFGENLFTAVADGIANTKPKTSITRSGHRCCGSNRLTPGNPSCLVNRRRQDTTIMDGGWPRCVERAASVREPQHLLLTRPCGRCIEQAGDTDSARQPTIDRAPALVSDFELGHVSSDQNKYTFGQYLAPLELLSTACADQFYIANVATLHAVPTGYRPSILVLTRIDPSVPIAIQCSIHGSTD